MILPFIIIFLFLSSIDQFCSVLWRRRDISKRRMEADKFETAVFVVHNLPKDGPVKTSNEEKLKFYGLYKQATCGKCDVAKPSFFDIQGSYKWTAWNNLGDMDQSTAKEKYVEAIVEKIKLVQAEYKTEEWMKGDSYTILAPKMEILGVLEKEKEKEKKEEDKIVIVDKADVVEQSSESKKGEKDEVEMEETATNSTVCPLSDAEYADAIDDEDQSRSSSFTEPRASRSHRRQKSPSLRSSCVRLERELKSISTQIEKMGKAVETRHNLLLSLMKKATVYVLVPRAISFRSVIFFIFWPFVAHFLIRWLRRFMRFM